MKKRVVVIADLHCGHKVGLTPPEWHYDVPEVAPHSVRKQAEFRKAQWAFYVGAIQKLQPIHNLLILGDCIDGDQEKCKGVELITTDRNEQARMAIACIGIARAKKHAFVYGTPYHTGNQEDFEDSIAEKFGGEIGVEQDVTVNGVVFNGKHFIGNSNSPMSQMTAINAERLRNLLWADRGQKPKADVILRAHVHRYAHVEGDNWMGFVCPPLQGLGSRIARRVSGLPLSFGLLWFDIDDHGNVTWGKNLQPLSAQAGKVLAW